MTGALISIALLLLVGCAGRNQPLIAVNVIQVEEPPADQVVVQRRPAVVRLK